MKKVLHLSKKQIAFKLYEKARKAQDKKEYLLSECVKHAQNEDVDIKAAVRKYQDVKCQEFALNARANIQCSAEFIEEKDSLKRYNMKESSYERAYNACINSGV